MVIIEAKSEFCMLKYSTKCFLEKLVVELGIELTPQTFRMTPQAKKARWNSAHQMDHASSCKNNCDETC